MVTSSTSRRSSHSHRPADRRHRRKATCQRSSIFYVSILVFFVFIIAFFNHLLNKMPNEYVKDGTWAGLLPARHRPPPASSVRFRPVDLMRRLEEQGKRLDRLRSEGRVGIRPPRLALVLGNMNNDPQSLLPLTIVKGLRELGYMFTVYALEDGEAHSFWEQVGCQVSILLSDSSSTIDWSNYEGVILSSVEAQRIITSFLEHPFNSIPLVWIIHEDILGRRLTSYKSSGWENLVTMWRSSFSRADVVVFPDSTLAMTYSSLDTGNFYVIPGSPVNVWESEHYITSHSRSQLRKDNGFDDGDLIILVMGSYFLYDELPWEYAVVMNALIPEVKKVTRTEGLGGKFKFVILCGDSTAANDSTFQELDSHMGFPVDSIKRYGVDDDISRVLLMADLVLYGSFQQEQSFPPLLVRAMSFEIPIIVPNLDIITKYVVDQVHGIVFHPTDLGTLVTGFSLLIEDNKLSDLAHKVASSGKLLSKNILALDCIADYGKLIENVLQFPSDTILPLSVSHIKQNTWAWDSLEEEDKQTRTSVQRNSFQNNHTMQKDSIVDFLEEQATGNLRVENATQIANGYAEDFPTQVDWDILTEMDIFEDSDRREREEIAERTPRYLGEWDTVYNNARKADKITKFESNERDEAELEKIGLQLCIYEVYSGQGAWPFLQHGSLYRGISLSKRAQRSRSDDVDAVGRLPILNDTYYRDRLCEFGAMFSIANKVDSIHNMPWIGFQSWHAVGRKVSLSISAEEVLQQTAQEKTAGDVIFFWSPMDQQDEGKSKTGDFWSMCDNLNAGHCRAVFEEALRLMYGLPEDMSALPPMPDDGDKWSALHSWVMPTPSFLEFVMFSRMFVDSMERLSLEGGNSDRCVLGLSVVEKKHCYCRVLDFLVNVWAYHSARRMVYINPSTGEMKEQHHIDERTGKMWIKYFSSSLLKSMDEELAEEADDSKHPADGWLWPLTGEVHWSGIFDREREDKYRRKMDKKRKNKEKLLDRQKHGYKQKSLGGKR